MGALFLFAGIRGNASLVTFFNHSAHIVTRAAVIAHARSESAGENDRLSGPCRRVDRAHCSASQNPLNTHATPAPLNTKTVNHAKNCGR